MKRRLLILVGITLLLCGCGSYSSKDAVNDFKSKVEESKSYKLSGTMEISNDEEAFVYNLESYYLKDNYYKVILVNQTNNHEQIILKNNDDVYVITPELNKSFKFQSEWPDNSSQAYLLSSLLKDIMNDESAELIQNEDEYILKSKVSYPNNEELTYQKVYFDKNMNIKKVEVFDEKDIVKIKVNFDKVDLKANLTENDFKLEEYIDKNKTDCEESGCNEQKQENAATPGQNTDANKEATNATESPKSDENNTNKTESTPDENNASQPQQNKTTNTNSNPSSFNLDSVIYPLYIPSDTYLTNSETIQTDNGNRVILTFTGEKNFVIIEEKAVSAASMEVIPVYGDPLMLTTSIGAISANSLTWDSSNVSYYLASTDLTQKEMLTIANSLGNTTLVSKEK